jgi:hypothetical protein
VLVDDVYQDYSTDPTRAVAVRLAPGTHTVTVVLADASHTELTPLVSDTISVNVADDPTAITIDADGFVLPVDSASVFVPIAITNATGPYNVYLDGVYETEGTAESVRLDHLAAGAHLVEVRLAAADGTEDPAGAVDTARLNVASDRPDLTFTSPAEGEVVTSSFYVQLDVQNFTLDPSDEDGPNLPDTGHYHVFVDGFYNTTGTAASVLVTGLSPGDHVLSAELVNNDHTDLDAPVWSGDLHVTVE